MGVQFHPESVLTEHGERLVANFFVEAGVAISAVATRHDDADRGEPAQTANAVSIGLIARRFEGRVDAWARLARRHTP